MEAHGTKHRCTIVHPANLQPAFCRCTCYTKARRTRRRAGLEPGAHEGEPNHANFPHKAGFTKRQTMNESWRNAVEAPRHRRARRSTPPTTQRDPGQLLRAYIRSKRAIQEVYELAPPSFWSPFWDLSRDNGTNPGTHDLIRNHKLKLTCNLTSIDGDE